MAHNLDESTALLERTPAALNALLRGLPEIWTLRDEGLTSEGKPTFTVRDVVAHLIHADRTDWIPRTKHILTVGESEPFPPFHRFGHVQESEGKTLDQLLVEFAAVRAECLAELRALKLTSADLERRGRHPAFASATLSELLATWAAHDLTHLHQIARVMAHQYRAAVGPWVRYLGVMHCNGHSANA